ncbi:hypothetical protein BKA69DRAFT_1120679 [Paraphysoderma sedebokerense]|nr:hypothetical protein BKA69DRAFT_1120679 [Paraphysoderma sedebokerense]
MPTITELDDLGLPTSPLSSLFPINFDLPTACSIYVDSNIISDDWSGTNGRTTAGQGYGADEIRADERGIEMSHLVSSMDNMYLDQSMATSPSISSSSSLSEPDIQLEYERPSEFISIYDINQIDTAHLDDSQSTFNYTIPTPPSTPIPSYLPNQTFEEHFNLFISSNMSAHSISGSKTSCGNRNLNPTDLFHLISPFLNIHTSNIHHSSAQELQNLVNLPRYAKVTKFSKISKRSFGHKKSKIPALRGRSKYKFGTKRWLNRVSQNIKRNDTMMNSLLNELEQFRLDGTENNHGSGMNQHEGIAERGMRTSRTDNIVTDEMGQLVKDLDGLSCD